MNTIHEGFDYRQMELNALLEITQAINNNLPEESLYKIFHFTLRSNLIIKKLALFVNEQGWLCKANFGIEGDLNSLNHAIFNGDITSLHFLPKNNNKEVIDEFDVLIPIAHKDQVLAYILADGDETFGEIAKKEKFNFIQTIGNILMVAVENKRFGRRQLEQEALRKELEIAAQVQSTLVPRKLPQNTSFQIEAFYLPHHNIGGDYYDYLKVDNDKFILCIGDVSGKGVPAAIYMSNFQASLRALVYQKLSLCTIVEQLNFLTKESTGGDNFVTFFCALINPESKTIEYINAGHNAPVIFKKNNVEYLDLGTTILGVFDKLPFLKVGTTKYQQGDLLFMYTDGITETENLHGVPYDIEKVCGFFDSLSPAQWPNHQRLLLQELSNFKGEQKKYNDDITMVSCLFH